MLYVSYVTYDNNFEKKYVDDILKREFSFQTYFLFEYLLMFLSAEGTASWPFRNTAGKNGFMLFISSTLQREWHKC